MEVNTRLLQQCLTGRAVRIAKYAPRIETQLGVYGGETQQWIFDQEFRDDVYILVGMPLEWYLGRWWCFIGNDIGNWLYIPLDCLIFCASDERLTETLNHLNTYHENQGD